MEKTKAWKVDGGFRTLISALHLSTRTRMRRFRKPEQAQDHGTPAFKKKVAADAAWQGTKSPVPSKEMLSNFYW